MVRYNLSNCKQSKHMHKGRGDWTRVESDHAGVQIWLDICKKASRGPGLFKVNGSLLDDPLKLKEANLR